MVFTTVVRAVAQKPWVLGLDTGVDFGSHGADSGVLGPIFTGILWKP